MSEHCPPLPSVALIYVYLLIFPTLQEAEQLDQQGTGESLRQAITKFEEALTLGRAVGNRLGKATILGY